jgi:hypothetical protein
MPLQFTSLLSLPVHIGCHALAGKRHKNYGQSHLLNQNLYHIQD